MKGVEFAGSSIKVDAIGTGHYISGVYRRKLYLFPKKETIIVPCDKTISLRPVQVSTKDWKKVEKYGKIGWLKGLFGGKPEKLETYEPYYKHRYFDAIIKGDEAYLLEEISEEDYWSRTMYY